MVMAVPLAPQVQVRPAPVPLGNDLNAQAPFDFSGIGQVQ